ncbi:MAG: hypothetical protein ACR2NZ_15400 [Rubripirellula sp.]
MRTFLDGRFENSAFCVLEPDGQQWLTRASRGPEQVLGRGGSATQQMERLAMRYPAKADLKAAIVQDFHSFRQALNVASADQRVLVVVNAPQGRESELRESLKAVSNDERIIGRFHFDFESDGEWREKVQGVKTNPGIVLVRPGEFGMTGTTLNQLSLDATTPEIIAAMQDANQRFARTTEKKEYSQHVAKGRSQGIYFEGAVPYGEDRDGDGEVDHGGSQGRGAGSPSRSRGRSRGGPPTRSRP